MTTAALVRIPAGGVAVEGMLDVPDDALGVVLFAHGSGSSRHSPRNNHVAGVLRQAGLGTLLMDLLTPDEDHDYARRFDIGLLTARLEAAAHWVTAQPATEHLPLGFFGASTGAAAALDAAAALGNRVRAVVPRGGRPDLASPRTFAALTVPTLLLVGGDDTAVIELNQQALDQLHCTRELLIVPGATHLFEEPGTLETVARSAAHWFVRFLPAAQ